MLRPPLFSRHLVGWALAHGRLRAPWVAAALLAGVVGRCAQPAPAAAGEAGLARFLGEAINGQVTADDVRWAPSVGLADAVAGRPVLFLGRGAPAPEGPVKDVPRDLYRAWVRLSPEGHPVAVTALRNLTNTPLGDEMGLAVKGRRAAFATTAFHRVQNVSLLEPGGPITQPGDPWWAFLTARISRYQRWGDLRGLDRTDIVLDGGPRLVEFDLGREALSVTQPSPLGRLRFDLGTRVLASESGRPALARALPARRARQQLIHWAVDTARQEVGPGPVAWFERLVFGARERVSQTFGVGAESRKLAAGPPARARIVDAARLERAGDAWPPPPVPSLWDPPKDGEGVWAPVTIPWLRSAGSGEPRPYFQTTTIYPDRRRPHVELTLIAIDMRQLELRMEAGFEEPKPVAGPPGVGHLPRDPKVLSRVVATFNGAFKASHGRYGMMARGRLLVPPAPDAATVVTLKDGSTALGTWPNEEGPDDEGPVDEGPAAATEDDAATSVKGTAAPAKPDQPTATPVPEDVVAFRQNLDPLLANGIVNPTGRKEWGWEMPGQAVTTHRSALCLTAAGQLYYAWSERIDGETLSQGLRQAGCDYAIHLDMNPGHCGFVFTDVMNQKQEEYNLKLLDRRMGILPDKYVRWVSKDFFYLVLREHQPSLVGDRASGWAPSPGGQPSPGLIPGVWDKRVTIGTLAVTLTAFEPDQTEWRVRSGTLEPAPAGVVQVLTKLEGADAHRALAAVGLGHSTAKTSMGLAFGPAPAQPLEDDLATLVAGRQRPLRLVPRGKVPLLPGEEAVQLPALARDGTPLRTAGSLGALRERGALCIAPGPSDAPSADMVHGPVVVATGRHDSDAPLVRALLDVGCRTVVRLDRGSHHGAFVHRTGTESAPTASYEVTALFALGRPVKPRARRWEP